MIGAVGLVSCTQRKLQVRLINPQETLTHPPRLLACRFGRSLLPVKGDAFCCLFAYS